MRPRLAPILLAAAALMGARPTASAARAPVTPTNRPAQLVARYVDLPTAFAFSSRRVFMSDGTLQPLGIGGVYVLKNGTARRLDHSPPFSLGVAWRNHTLFISAGAQLLAWRGWNGRKFTQRHTIYTAPPGSTGFTGLAFAPNGRLYVGVDKGRGSDPGVTAVPSRYDVLSMTPRGNHVRIVAQGIRQPWQFVFQARSQSPFVTDLGQISGARQAPDLLLRVRRRQDYGFPSCNWTQTSLCRGFARPVRFFPAHSDPMGLAILGQRLYISEYGVRTPAQVISVPLSGVGNAQTVLSGFPRRRHIVGLGADDGWLYVGETATGKKRFGSVWRFQPG